MVISFIIMNIETPTLLINKARVYSNISRIMEKISNSPTPVRFRPHFKTHQSTLVGEWFRDLGITSITVSSVEMGFYFALDGWNDITIAVLVNPNEIQSINRLAEETELNLLIDSSDVAKLLDEQLERPSKTWIKIDTGYQRTGIVWNNFDEIYSLIETIQHSEKLNFRGLLTHSGHSYHAKSTSEIMEIYLDTVSKMNEVRDFLGEKNIAGVEISIGDTPTCSVTETYNGIDEVRCGNFVFYDIMQLNLGTCKEDDIAAAVACPVLACYPHRNDIVIQGGAVHLSKDFIPGSSENRIYGKVAFPIENNDGIQGWGPILENTSVYSISQEHGIIRTTPEVMQKVKVGDTMIILPIHSCLTANLLKHTITVVGES